MKTVAEEVRDLDQLSVPDLVARYAEVHGKPPRSKHRAFLVKRIAHRLAEARTGGLSEVARKRLDELMAEIDIPLSPPETTKAPLSRRSRRDGPLAGTVYSRVWHGREVRVTAVDGGFECDGVVHRSLSAVAKAVTGTHWNGRLFFGLTERKARR